VVDDSKDRIFAPNKPECINNFKFIKSIGGICGLQNSKGNKQGQHVKGVLKVEPKNGQYVQDAASYVGTFISGVFGVPLPRRPGERRWFGPHH